MLVMDNKSCLNFTIICDPRDLDQVLLAYDVGVLSKERIKDYKTKSGVSSVSRSGTLKGTLCLEIMRFKIKATHEILQSMFLSHDLSQGAIPRIRLRIRS